MHLSDAHCHLQDESLIAQTGEVMQRARLAGVEQFLCCGTRPADWEAVKRLSLANSTIIPFFGLHPWYVQERTSDWLETLRQQLQQISSGVGEIGLDHALSNRDDALQEEVFRQQLELARELKRPVNLHCRRAWERMAWFLETIPMQQNGVIIHSFSGAAEWVPRLAELGVYFSFSGSITRSNNTRGHRALQAVPMERLLLETDAPDLPPVINHTLLPENTNEPANLVYVLAKAAELKFMQPDQLAEVVWQNTQRLLTPLLTQNSEKGKQDE